MFDLDTFTSKAIDEFAAREPALVEQRNAAFDKARAHAATMKMADVKAALADDAERGRIKMPHLDGKENKSTLLDLAADAYAAASDAGETLTRLGKDARADREMAANLNRMVRDAAAAQLKLTHEVDKAGKPVRLLEPHEMNYKLKWYGDEFHVAERLAVYAHRIFQAVGSGFDLREVAMGEQKEALRTVRRFPRDVLTNGLSGAARSDRMYDAAAANEFIDAVAWSYSQASGDDAEVARNLAC